MNKNTMTTTGLSLVHRPLQALTWMEGFICRLQPSIPEPLGCLTSISPPQPLLICPSADYACSLEGASAGSRGSCWPWQLSAQYVHTAATSPGFPSSSIHLIAHTPLSTYLLPASILSAAVAFSYCCFSSCQHLSNWAKAIVVCSALTFPAAAR